MKVALVTGINKYREPGIDLRGCVNDAVNMEQLFSNIYNFDIIEYYINEEVCTDTVPLYLQKCISSLSDGDEFVWYHSGHGTQVPDLENDESDSSDEALVLHDSTWETMYTDDMIRKAFRNFPKKAYCTFIFDTCFSGGMYRATHALRTIKPPENLMKKVRSHRNIRRFVDKMPSNSVMISACQENQYSEESVFDDKVQGAFTRALINHIRNKGVLYTNSDLCNRISILLRSNGFIQDPMLSGNKSMFSRYFLGEKKKTGFWAWFLSLFE